MIVVGIELKEPCLHNTRANNELNWIVAAVKQLKRKAASIAWLYHGVEMHTQPIETASGYDVGIDVIGAAHVF